MGGGGGGWSWEADLAAQAPCAGRCPAPAAGMRLDLLAQRILALSSPQSPALGVLLSGFSASTLALTHCGQRDPTKTCSVPLLQGVWCVPLTNTRFPILEHPPHPLPPPLPALQLSRRGPTSGPLHRLVLLPGFLPQICPDLLSSFKPPSVCGPPDEPVAPDPSPHP